MIRQSRGRLEVSTWHRARAVVALSVWALTLAGAAIGAPSDLRLYAVRPDVFGYLFTAVSTGADHQPVLAFMDLAGTTRFVRPGEKLGDWTVVDYQARTDRIFKPSVNAQLTVDTSIARLRNAAGVERLLTVGVPLEQSGRLACLVSLTSGDWKYARAGDTLTLDKRALTVRSVGETTVQVRLDDQVAEVAQASDAERQAVQGLWRARQEQADAADAHARAEAQQRQQAARAAADARAAAVAPVVHAPQAVSRITFGTEYRYPTEYEVVPFVTRMPNGSLRHQTIVAPTRFDTRSFGISQEVR